jgi:hypothetical protein
MQIIARDAKDTALARQKRNRKGFSWAALALVALLTATPAWAGRKNVEAMGSLFCGGLPLANVTVELVEYRWPGWTDPVIDRGVTDAAGGFSLRGTGGWIFGDPTTYLRVRYRSLVPPFPEKDVRIHDELGSIRSGTGPQFPYRPAVINMGALSSSGLDCALWQGLDRAVADYRNEADAAAPIPYGGVSILRWSAASAGVPFATLSTISWPTGFVGSGVRGANSIFHEFGHTVRHSFDGDTIHFLDDVVRLGYLRNHNYCDVTNPGYAFNEAWAWFWETRSSPVPRDRLFCNATPRWDVEGDVAADLRQWSRCLGYANLVRVLRDNPGTIHSRDEFVAALRRRFPTACLPPAPPPPSSPGACAAGTITQQFYDDVVGCAGTVRQVNAGSLCGASHRLCSGSEWVAARRTLTPAHNYWVNGALNFVNLGGGQCSANALGGTACGPASMHVCKDAGNDPEGNTCTRRNCSFETPLGTEFPPNQFFGGCAASDTTAGALCCPRALMAGGGGGASSGLAAEDAPAPDPDAALRLRTEARAALERIIAGLESRLDEARRAAQGPEACSQPEACAAAVTAMAQPALLEGEIAWRRLQLEMLEASPASTDELHAKIADGTFEDWRRDLAREYATRTAAVLIPALREAIAALLPGRARPDLAPYVDEAVRNLEQQIARLEAWQRQPDGVPAGLEMFDAAGDTGFAPLPGH